jgi:predicted HTH transcriptional regulator
MTEQELLSKKEAHDFEAKSAQGRFGDGTVPDSIWETYSAMANTSGGYIVLGAEEQSDGSLSFIGIGDIDDLQAELWNSLNNQEVVNQNILRNKDVEVLKVDGKDILLIQVPRANRRRRPIYVGENPMTGTYRRGYEGDYRCDEPTVRRMMAEAAQDSRDDQLLEGFDLDDID